MNKYDLDLIETQSEIERKRGEIAHMVIDHLNRINAVEYSEQH